MNKLSELQERMIANWLEKSTFSDLLGNEYKTKDFGVLLEPDGASMINLNVFNESQDEAVQWLAGMKYLDELGVPRSLTRSEPLKGLEYNLVGRIMWMQERHIKILQRV